MRAGLEFVKADLEFVKAGLAFVKAGLESVRAERIRESRESFTSRKSL